MTVDHRQNHLEVIRSSISLVISPIQYVVNLPFVITRWAQESMQFRNQLIIENRELRKKQTLLEVKLQKLESLEVENSRLREMLLSAKKNWERVLIAELISIDFDPFKRLIQINKGSRDGVYVGHPLLDAHGIMGQVIHVSPYTSTAMLIIDASHGIPVKVVRNGLRTVALGTGEADRMELPHIPNSADIKVGDLLVTSGLGLRFPSGYPVAKVTKVNKNPAEQYAQIDVIPTARIEHAQEILLVWPEDRQHNDTDGGGAP
jgi:rod shape-determining protein MreC